MSFGYGIPLQAGYDLGSKIPLDSRTSVDTLKELNELKDSILPDGLVTYCKETESYYSYVDKRSEWVKVFVVTSTGDTPLMNGTPSAGTKLGIYSRADHVHPTDSTRASVQYVQQLNFECTQKLNSIIAGEVPVKLNKVLTIGSKTYNGTQDVTISNDELLSWNSLQTIFNTHGIKLSDGKIEATEIISNNIVSYRKI